jgi:hypothetical protein
MAVGDPVVHVVDDDGAARESLAFLLGTAQLRVRAPMNRPKPSSILRQLRRPAASPRPMAQSRFVAERNLDQAALTSIFLALTSVRGKRSPLCVRSISMGVPTSEWAPIETVARTKPPQISMRAYVRIVRPLRSSQCIADGLKIENSDNAPKGYPRIAVAFRLASGLAQATT